MRTRSAWVVAEIVRIHRATRLVGDVPEGFDQLGLALVAHVFLF